MIELPTKPLCFAWQTLLLASLHVSCAQAQSQTPVDFSSQIRPILSENCFYCHGPDAEQRQAGLRLDVEADARNVFDPSDVEASELFARISTDDPDELMPPADSNRQLTAEQIVLIRRWIKEGGTWGQHWAYRPITKPDPVTGQSIDTFVQRTLKQNSLSFSPPADRATLIRRLSLDLTGLPPTTEQIDSFLEDASPNAYEKVVDRFLQSQAYGERMAWSWLDAARYADTNGYQGDNERTMWPWRDWVIKAYNNNMPLDQFTIWQLAGDLLPDATEEQILATGFNRNHPINGEGGRIPEENRVDYVMDMSETTGTLWLGLTFNCCRCHDHKYDQLTQDDYYSLFAFFNQTPVTGAGGDARTPPVLAVLNPQQKLQRESLNRSISKINHQLELISNSVADEQAQWETAQLAEPSDTTEWHVFNPVEYSATNAEIKTAADSSLLTFGPNPDNDNYFLSGKTQLASISGVRLEALSHASMTGQGLTRSPSSNFVLTDFLVFLHQPGQDPKPIRIASAQADFEQPGHRIELAIDGDSKTGWAIYAKNKDMRQHHEAVFVLAEPVSVPNSAALEVVLKHQSVHRQHNLGRLRISLTGQPEPKLSRINQELLAVLKIPSKHRSTEQSQLARQAFLENNTGYQESQKQLIEAQAKLKSLDGNIPRVMVMADQDQFRKSYRLNRGSYQQPLNEVTARVPEMLPPLPEGVKHDRLALAQWLFDTSNPLTARVTVNRLWEQFFGTGIVKTTEDFGVQGEPPSHPELLDWLAEEYRKSGWDTKHMIRLIVTSQTYQQTSQATPNLQELDPQNRLLARSSRFRMPSWMIRDHALAVSGRLVTTIGGQPVNSYQPAGVWEESSFGNKKYNRGTGDQLYRRSIYTFWRRIAAPTMIFDNADRMTCSVSTYRTNTPLHALTMLNDVTFVEASRLLATDVLSSSLSDRESLHLIFKRVVGRSIQTAEEDILLSGLDRTRAQFTKNPGSAESLIELGESPPDHQLEAVELASWTSLCLAVLNLDEAQTRQ